MTKSHRHIPLIFTIMLVCFGCGAVCTRLFTWIHKTQEYNSILANCSSDTLSPIGNVLTAYVTKKGILPSRQELRAFGRTLHLKNAELQCLEEGNSHFVWNGLFQKKVRPHPWPVIWCRPDAHNAFVAVLFVAEDGKATVRVLTDNELAEILSRELEESGTSGSARKRRLKPAKSRE